MGLISLRRVAPLAFATLAAFPVSVMGSTISQFNPDTDISWSFILPTAELSTSGSIDLIARIENIGSHDFHARDSHRGFGFNGGNVVGAWTAFPKPYDPNPYFLEIDANVITTKLPELIRPGDSIVLSLGTLTPLEVMDPKARYKVAGNTDYAFEGFTLFFWRPAPEIPNQPIASVWATNTFSFRTGERPPEPVPPVPLPASLWLLLTAVIPLLRGGCTSRSTAASQPDSRFLHDRAPRASGQGLNAAPDCSAIRDFVLPGAVAAIRAQCPNASGLPLPQFSGT